MHTLDGGPRGAAAQGPAAHASTSAVWSAAQAPQPAGAGPWVKHGVLAPDRPATAAASSTPDAGERDVGEDLQEPVDAAEVDDELVDVSCCVLSSATSGRQACGRPRRWRSCCSDSNTCSASARRWRRGDRPRRALLTGRTSSPSGPHLLAERRLACVPVPLLPGGLIRACPSKRPTDLTHALESIILAQLRL